MAFPTTGLVSYWKLDESSGTRVDSVGTNHLTPTNAPVGAAGKIGNGCDFESSSAQVLSCPDDPTINLTSTDFTFTGWLNPESLPSYAAIFSKDPASSFEYRAQGSSLALLMNGSITVTIPGLSVGSWAFFVCGLDTVADVLFLQLNNGAPASVSTAATPTLVSVALNVGGRSDGSIGFDGLIDEVGFWKRVLTAQERTDLYNGGAGLAYAPEPPVLDAPTLTSIAPNQGVQGSTVAVTLTGTGFVVGATTVTVGGSGVTVTTVVVSGPTSLTANVVLDPTAAATARPVTVTTAGGTSGARLFTITALPVEPPEPGALADSSAVDTALITALASDATLATLLPGGVHFGLAPQGKTAFALVTLDETADLSVFAETPAQRRAIEAITYAVQAVVQTSATAPATQAAARIDALLQDQPLTVPGYGWLSTVRVERLRPPAELDPNDKSIRWQHHGGRYRVQVTPLV